MYTDRVINLYNRRTKTCIFKISWSKFDTKRLWPKYLIPYALVLLFVLQDFYNLVDQYQNLF